MNPLRWSPSCQNTLDCLFGGSGGRRDYRGIAPGTAVATCMPACCHCVFIISRIACPRGGGSRQGRNFRIVVSSGAPSPPKSIPPMGRRPAPRGIIGFYHRKPFRPRQPPMHRRQERRTASLLRERFKSSHHPWGLFLFYSDDQIIELIRGTSFKCFSITSNKRLISADINAKRASSSAA